MSSDELDRLREDVIEKITVAFPITEPFNRKLTLDFPNQDGAYHNEVARERLTEMLTGKNWWEVVSHRSVIYNLIDPDHQLAITGEAHFYYLPALLVATLIREEFTYSRTVFEEICEFAASFSIPQLKAVMAYLECHEKYELNDPLVRTGDSYYDKEPNARAYSRLSKFLDEYGSRARRDEWNAAADCSGLHTRV
jgi:hypothetical protein